jgi:hypothetical protein
MEAKNMFHTAQGTTTSTSHACCWRCGGRAHQPDDRARPGRQARPDPEEHRHVRDDLPGRLLDHEVVALDG